MAIHYYDKAVPTEKEAELLWGEKGPQFRKRIVETLQKRFGPNFEETKYKKIFKKRVNLRENWSSFKKIDWRKEVWEGWGDFVYRQKLE